MTQQQPLIVGIDLGTTNSLIAYMNEGTPRVIADSSGKTMVPSVVSFPKDGPNILVGDAARSRLESDPENTIYSIKRYMGRGLSELEQQHARVPFQLAETERGMVQVQIREKNYTPPEISALILQDLKKRAEDFLQTEVRKAVITVPAYFNDAQRQATKDAGRIAGLEVLRIINEPTSASLAYGLQQKKEGIIAVYDLGGGTFDISILKIKQGIFEVLSTNGNTLLGGDDIDQKLMETLIQEDRLTSLQVNARSLQALRIAVERAKCRLSFEDQVELEILVPGTDHTVRRVMTRAEFEAIATEVIDQTLPHCHQALADAGLQPEAVDDVILVGGSTRIPLVRKKVAEIFARIPHSQLNPEEVVARGAAIQADILAGGTQDMLLLDVTPLSLGIETLGGVISVLIPRNTKIPTSAQERFTTSVDGQSTVDIHVLQGERELAGDNRSLAKFLLREIDPMPAGTPMIEVTFLIDANGILNVTARELRSGREQSVEVKPTYGLTEDEVESMVEDSYRFAESDVIQRMLIESRNDAAEIIRHATTALKESGHQISRQERQQIEKALNVLKKAVQGDDHGQIRDGIRKLDEETRGLAERMMDRVLKETVKGKNIKS